MTASAFVLVALTVLCFIARRRAPYLLFGWLWYLGTLVPVIGLLQIGEHSIADRYTYLPLIGIFIAICFGIDDLARRWPKLRPALAASSVVVLVALAWTSFVQTGYWRSSKALYRRAIGVTRGNFVAENNLANVLDRAGERAEAEEHYLSALRVRPQAAVTHYNLANLLARTGRPEPRANIISSRCGLRRNSPKRTSIWRCC